jgi:hypothetical protein
VTLSAAGQREGRLVCEHYINDTYIGYDSALHVAVAKTGSEIVAELEKLSVEELKDKLDAAGLVSRGSKSELVVRLALWTHKSSETKAGRLCCKKCPISI